MTSSATKIMSTLPPPLIGGGGYGSICKLYGSICKHYGSICKLTLKAYFLKCLMEFTDDSNKETYEAPSVDGCIITGAALLQMNNL